MPTLEEHLPRSGPDRRHTLIPQDPVAACDAAGEHLCGSVDLHSGKLFGHGMCGAIFLSLTSKLRFAADL